MGSQEVHRSGPLKQDNKRHKFGKHRTNRSIDSQNKGRREDVKTITRRKDLCKRHERRNQLKQLRHNRRLESLSAKRGIGGADCLPPIVVAVLDTSGGAADVIMDLIRGCDDCVFTADTNDRNFVIRLPKLKTRFELIVIDGNDLFSALDSAKVADVLLLVHSSAGADLSIVDAIYSHCLPTTVHVVHGLNGLNVKKRNDVKKAIQKLIDSKFGNERLRSVDSGSDVSQLLHYISNCKRKQNTFRRLRTQMLAEKIVFNAGAEESSPLGTLMVWGYVRNRALDVNSLVHIPGFGDYQMSTIEVLTDPHSMASRRETKDNESIAGDSSGLKFVLRSDPIKQQTLDSENIADPMEGEQTWPTEEELMAAEEKQKIVKKVPKGTSDYQAVWIVDDSNDEEDNESDGEEDSDSDEEEMLEMEAQEESDDEKEGDEEVDELDTMSIVSESVNDVNYDKAIDMTEEQSMHRKFKEQRQYELFPDEVDTPNDRLAKVRFARYRGLKSFRTSSWDPKENLPKDYSRIYQFENFCRTKKRVLNAEQTGAQNGWYVCVHVLNVPEVVFESFKDNRRPLLLYGLLPHEHRMSTMNLVIKRVPSFDEPIQSKETLVFHVGCRRFRAAPIFSAHTNGDKHKSERFLRSDVSSVATLYAPITFPTASVLVYKEYPSGGQRLVATGSLLDCNPDRVVVKRLVLSGHPFKINRKHAVVRYMFFNREDIMWFRPIELRTKYGRKGHIREPLGTHGHMKCVFDRQLNSEDTVLMNLYKRVFPKWSFEHLLCSPAPVVKSGDRMEESI